MQIVEGVIGAKVGSDATKDKFIVYTTVHRESGGAKWRYRGGTGAISSLHPRSSENSTPIMFTDARGKRALMPSPKCHHPPP